MIALNLIFSLWNTFSETFSSYGPVYAWNKHKHIKKLSQEDYGKLGDLVPKGVNIGYILNENSYTRGIHISDFSYLQSINNNVNTYRLNSTEYDESNIGANRILKKSIFYDSHGLEKNSKTQILMAINSL